MSAGAMSAGGPESAGALDAALDGALDAALIAAHGAGDGAGLARLYARAAAWAEREARFEAAGFFRVQAYVFALEAGDPIASDLHARLKAEGREE